MIIIGAVGNFSKSYCQSTEYQVKSSYILNFIEETSWPSEIDTFNISILGSENIYNNLNKISSELTVKDKPFLVRSCSSILDLQKSEVVFISGKYLQHIITMKEKLDESLIITDEGSNDQNAMIVFFKNDESKIQFRLNISKFKESNLSPSAKLLVYGGQNEEAFGIINQSEKELEKQIKKIEEKDELINKKEHQIIKLSEKMNLLESQISIREENIDKLITTIDEQERKVWFQEELLDSLKRSYNVEKQYAQNAVLELQKIEQQLNSKQDSLNRYHSLLTYKGKEIEENNSILDEQKGKIRDQTSKLSKLDSQLKQSELYFWIILGVVIIILIVTFFLLRENKIKNKNLLIIEEQNKKITESSMHKDRFIANITHEVRTPLNAITGYTNLLLSKHANSATKPYLQRVIMSSNSLLSIINDILDLSKIEAGKIEFETINYDLPLVLQNTFDSMRLMAESKNLNYQLIIDENLPEYVNSDPTRLSQVLLNLVSNSVKFTDKGDVILRIKLLKNEGGESDVLFSIEDTGKGISKDKQVSVFESFTQEDASTTRKYGGTGLGLTISQRIIKLMGGEIKVQSELGKGSIFSFNLTMKNADTSSILYSDVNEIVVDGMASLNIVIADDEKLNRELIYEQFSHWNSEVKIDLAKDGGQLLSMVSKKEYDVVLTDVRMPVINGVDATRQIKQMNSDIIVIGISANALEKDVKKCLDAGMDGYVTKPVNFDDLLIKIAKLMKLPYEVRPIKVKETSPKNTEKDAVKYFKRLNNLCETKEEFLNMQTELINEIEEILFSEDLQLTHGKAHSLLNKINYVNDENLISIAREVEVGSREEESEALLKQMEKLKKYWLELKTKFE